MNTKFTLSEMDLAAIKVTAEYNQKNNAEYSKIVLRKVGVLLQLMNSLHEEQVKIESWLVWTEPLIQKLCFHSVSMLKLFEGTEIPLKSNGKDIVVFDKPSVVAILRVITENFLTFNYIYSTTDDEKEKQFRLSVWRYCGIKQRVEFDLKTESAREKQVQEGELLNNLKTEVVNSVFYMSLNKKEQLKVLEGRNPRMFNSWIRLIKMSGLRNRLFKNMYGYKSNYSHSEFISVLQVHSGNYVFNPNAELEIELMLLHIIICKAILNLKEIFPTVKIIYDTMDLHVRNEIEFINRFGSDNELDNM